MRTLVYVFNGGNAGGFTGFGPQGTLAMDKKGNIYGTTQYGGGAYNSSTGEYACGSLGGSYGCGAVYELSQNGEGVWTATDLYDFAVNNANDGNEPVAGVTFGNTSATVLYGTTLCGGTSTPNAATTCAGFGAIYKLSYTKTGGWTETVLYSFPGTGNEGTLMTAPNGLAPTAGLLLNKGNLYGTTSEGPMYVNASGDQAEDGGVLFELSPGAEGWTFNQLYVFCTTTPQNACPDGAQPGHGTVVMDSEANLYGTTTGLGENNSVWQLPYSSATQSYANQVQILYSQPPDISGFESLGLGEWVLPYKNSLYVFEWSGASYYCCETLVKITNSAKTSWQATTIYQFPPSGGAGMHTLWDDVNQLIVDKNGNFYSMAEHNEWQARQFGPGGVFEISPMP